MTYTVMLVILLTMSFALVLNVVTCINTSRHNGRTILGVTLPVRLLKDATVKKVITQYRKNWFLVTVFFAVIMLPIAICCKYISVALMYLLFWSVLLLLVTHFLLKKYFNILYKLKIDEFKLEDNDDDKFWSKGYYYNPDDSRIFVKKRIGYGTTVNMATTFGKLSRIWIFVTIFFVLGIAIFLRPLDFGRIDVNITDSVVYIRAPLHKYKFNTADIKNVELIEKLPKAKKRIGGDSNVFYVGKFNVDTYGTANVYIYRQNPYIIYVKLKDGKLFFNAADEMSTKQYMEKLTKFIK